jgi:hypothetical protein
MKKIIILSFTVMLSVACQKEVVDNATKKNTEDTQSFSKEKDKENDKKKDKENDKKTVTIKGTLSGTSILIPSTACSASGFLNVGHGSGVSSHFGVFTFDNSDCLGLPYHSVFTYPNGEKAYTSQIGEFTNPLTGLPVQDAIFTGGTGKFKGATGTIRLSITKFEPTLSPGVYNVAGNFEGAVTLLDD